MRHNQLEKELQLMLLMTENRTYTVEQLCDRLQISRRNLYYYIDFFRDAGFVVEKHGTCYSLDKSSPFFTKLFKSVSITEDEAITIRRLLDKVSDNSLQVTSLKRKLERLYDLDILNSLATDEERAANVNALYDAMKLKRVVIIHNYSSPNSNTSRARVVEPFMFLNGNNDVCCYEITSKANKTFRVARMGRVEVLDDQWQHEQLHRRMFTDIFMFSSDRQEYVTLHLDRLAYNLIIEEYPKSQAYITDDNNRGWLLHLPVCSYLGIGRFVLGLYDHINIISPHSFSLYIHGQLTKFNEYTHADGDVHTGLAAFGSNAQTDSIPQTNDSHE